MLSLALHTACTNESFGIVPAENSCYGVPNLIVTNMNGDHAFKEVYPSEYFFPLTKSDNGSWSRAENFKILEEQYERIMNVSREGLVEMARSTFTADKFKERLDTMINMCLDAEDKRKRKKSGLDFIL